MFLRALCAVVCLTAAAALAQAPEPILANQNRTPAGRLENGILAVELELRAGAWHPEAEDGPPLFVQAIGEKGHPTQIPGPLLRVRENTTVHVTVTNKLGKKATVYGLMTRPGDGAKDEGLALAPGETGNITFNAGSAGTYYYWARTSEPIKNRRTGLTVIQPLREDAQMNGALIIDPAAGAPPDRIFVIDTMFVPGDIVQQGFEVLTINGKMYPFTEPLEYRAEEPIRWRVINSGISEHPMHLHGAFYQLLSSGDYASETSYAPADRQWVVTQDLLRGRTMMMEWEAPHAGRWLFHCHFHAHISTDQRLPILTRRFPDVYPDPDAPPAAHIGHDPMEAMNDMAGLVLAIDIKPRANGRIMQIAAREPHKIDLIVEPTASSANSPTLRCAVREGKKIVASEDKSAGPPIVVTRGEPVELTVLNRLKSPTTIHWHGIELESYYDGVIGGGVGNQVTPAIAPGGSFIARFTPNRAGTFIYHTHAADPDQLTGGVYGPLIVLEPGETFDPSHDKVLLLGTRDADFDAKRITINGSEQPAPLLLKQGEKYRLRDINMAPNLPAELRIGTKQHPATWRAIAKDGANLPARMVKTADASLHIVSGETYDFEFQSDAAGEIPLEVMNVVSEAKLMSKIVVQ